MRGMTTILGRIHEVAERQHDVVAHWQHGGLDLTPQQMSTAARGWRRVHRGVYALGDLTELGWLMAAALAGGPNAFISHRSALMVLGLRPYEPGVIDVTVEGRPGRRERDGLLFHRPRGIIDGGRCHGIPVTSPTASLKDADLQPYELYRALEQADDQDVAIDRTLLLEEVVELEQAVQGRTRSDAEARFILLCHDEKFELPLVNHHLNGFETDFHWPRQRLVVEVDGWEFHRERPQFEEDRRRTLVHTAAGYTVIRPSALHLVHEPGLVAAAVRSVL